MLSSRQHLISFICTFPIYSSINSTYNIPTVTMSDKPMDTTNLNKDTMPKAMDAQGSIGKQFTGLFLPYPIE